MSSIDEIRSKFVVDKVPEKNGREENKNITNMNYKSFKVEPVSLTIQINDSILEINDKMTDSQTEEKINEILLSNTQKEEPIIEIKESQKGINNDEKKHKKNKKFFFG